MNCGCLYISSTHVCSLRQPTACLPIMTCGARGQPADCLLAAISQKTYHSFYTHMAFLFSSGSLMYMANKVWALICSLIKVQNLVSNKRCNDEEIMSTTWRSDGHQQQRGWKLGEAFLQCLGSVCKRVSR